VPARIIMSTVGIQSAAVPGTRVLGTALGGSLIGSVGVGRPRDLSRELRHRETTEAIARVTAE
jgi:hypothetical protein